MVSVRKVSIPLDIITSTTRYLNDHQRWLEKIDHVACEDLDSLIFQLNKGDITYPCASRIRMYLEFRNRYLAGTCDHSEAIRNDIHAICALIDFYEFEMLLEYSVVKGDINNGS